MLFWIIVAIIVYFVFFKKKEGSSENSNLQNKTNKNDASLPHLATPISLDKYKISSGTGTRQDHLWEYLGDEDVLYVPVGVTWIGGSDQPLRRKGNDHDYNRRHQYWKAVYLPKSPNLLISDCALLCVENIYYEGTEAEFKERVKYDPEYNFLSSFSYVGSDWEHHEINLCIEYNYPVTTIYKKMIENKKQSEANNSQTNSGGQTVSTNTPKGMPNANIMENATAFVGLCKKIDALGRIGYGFDITKKETSPGVFDFYMSHTFWNVNYLDFACDSLKKDDFRMVEFYYKSILDETQLSSKEQGFFLQDLSDFSDFLRGGIEGWNTFVREDSHRITVEQRLGGCLQKEMQETEHAIQEAIKSSGLR